MVNLRFVKVGLLTYALGILVSMGVEYLVISNIGFYETHRYVVFTVSTAIALVSVILMIMGTNNVEGIKGTLSFLGCLLLLVGEVAGLMLGLSNYVTYLYGVNMPIDLLIIPAPMVNINRVELLTLALTLIGISGWLMLLLVLLMLTKGILNNVGLLTYTISMIILYAYSLGVSHVLNVYANYTAMFYLLVVLAVASTAGAVLMLIKPDSTQ
ncbi:hypothetical protein [Caldivirga maquilingensis]|uniref:hypothetical protein n=1 Tax=Caldivirga maquilingensis TaxID=76887 RepID=UPI0012EA5428|nr:hypothetical protein [Caldivirga maquilingensis]